ncbi:MAG: redoxin domain-containing protein [Verrucomicrobiales bacterium]
MPRHFLSVLTALLLAAPSAIAASEPSPSIENFALIDHEGKFHELDYYLRIPDTKGLVVFIQGNGCPLVQKRIPELARLKKAYQKKGILFCMLNANPQDEREEIAEEAEEFGIGMPILKDDSQLVARMLGVKRTAEAFLISAEDRKIVYRGAIDDRMTFQAEKPKAEHHYLKDAIEQFIAGEEITSAKTEAPGCKVSMPDALPQLTYTKDIAPILKNNCVSCHTKGGLGPFKMSSYKKVEGWADMIAEVILTKRMPPWHADPEIGTFSNDCSLSPEDAKKIITWVNHDCPRGEGADPLEGLEPDHPEWHMGEPDRVIDLPEQKVAAEGVFDYRYVTLDNPFDEDVWLTACEINPGNTRVLHHVIVTAREPEKPTDTEEEKKRKRRREQWITGYAPGTQGQAYPGGSAVHLRKGWKLRFQLHYTASGREEVDVTRLGLRFSTTPIKKPFRTAVIAFDDFEIPPRASEHPAEHTIEIKKDSTIYAINPHMHFRGKYMNFAAIYPDGKREALLSVPNYDFNWQRTYILEQPLKVPAGTRIHIRNAWDNSAQNPHNPDPKLAVKWGDQSFNEMFFATIGYIEN